MEPELYVGYEKRAPPAIARFVRRVTVALLLAVTVLAVALATLPRRADPGIYELGRPRTLSGVLRERPYPLLEVARPGAAGDAAPRSRYPLVGEGKHGAARQTAGLDGQQVELSGTLIHRDELTLVELVAGSLVGRAGAVSPPAAPEELGVHTFVGEIVDSKCFLGVMKPGRGKPHRACAALCIRGGIPPVLAVTTGDGARALLLLVDPEGRPVNDRVLDRVAEPVEVTGRLRRQGDLLVLAADPTTIRRLG